MMGRRAEPMELGTVLAFASSWLFVYSAWLTSIVFCSANGLRPLMIASATFFPIGVVHGIGVWLGGW